MPFDGRTFDLRDGALAVLRRAREHIAQPGAWCQGAPEKGNAKCAAHWPFHVMPGGPVLADAQEALFLALPSNWAGLGSIVDYNDHPGRTQEEIVALYDRAIALREGQPDGG